MKNVLVAVDSKSFGKAITQFIVNHFWPPDTQFEVLHVVEPSADSNAEQEAEELVNVVATAIRELLPSALVKTRITSGNPEHEIVETACSWPAEVVIVGSHGRRGVQRLVLGSVSSAVVTAAPCSVVVVKMPAFHAGEKALVESEQNFVILSQK